MNGRIKELACDAAMVEVVCSQKSVKVHYPKNFEKFAALIIRECIFVMKSTVDESIDFDRKLDETSSWIESDVKKHFGVEE